MKTEDITKIRNTIDAIDHQIHDLLIERAHLAQTIGNHKKQQGATLYTPSREAEIVKTLMKRHQGHIAFPHIIQIWREIISSILCLDPEFSVAVYQAKGENTYLDLAKQHFGLYCPMMIYTHLGDVIAATRDKITTIGVMPMPQPEDSNPWWATLTSTECEQPKIIAKLPFAPQIDQMCQLPSAFVIGFSQNFKTSDDSTVFVIETPETLARTSLIFHLTQMGLVPHFLSSSIGTPRYHLIEISGFFDDANQILQGLSSNNQLDILSLHIVGHYAKPIKLEA